MTVIRNTDDFLRALREHPEWKEAVRVEILGEELLSLPELVKENSRQIAELTEIMRQHDARLAPVEDRLGHLDGRFTEEMYRRAFATKVADIEGKIRRVKVLSRPEQADLSFDAADENLIDEAEAMELRDADVVAEGRIRSTGEEVTLLAEISNTVHIDDVLRAIKRAEIASRATDRRCIPVVMGEKADAIKDAPHSGVWLIEKNQTRELGGIN